MSRQGPPPAPGASWAAYVRFNWSRWADDMRMQRGEPSALGRTSPDDDAMFKAEEERQEQIIQMYVSMEKK